MSNPAARRSRPELLHAHSHSASLANGDVQVHFGGVDSITTLDGDGPAEGIEQVVHLNRNPPGGLAAKAGIIIGIHNLFIVLPQFISSGITSIIFALFDPTKSVRHGHNPGIGLPGNGTVPAGTSDSRNETLLSRSSILLLSRDEVEGGDRGANSVAIVFRLASVATLVAFILCWRLARELKKAR